MLAPGNSESPLHLREVVQRQRVSQFLAPFLDLEWVNGLDLDIDVPALFVLRFRVNLASEVFDGLICVAFVRCNDVHAMLIADHVQDVRLHPLAAI